MLFYNRNRLEKHVDFGPAETIDVFYPALIWFRVRFVAYVWLIGTSAQVLQDTIRSYSEKLAEITRKKKEGDARITELELEEERLTTRCKELVLESELTNEARLSKRFCWVLSL